MLALIVGIALLPLMTGSRAAHSQEQSLAVLVVGDQNAGILTQREKEIYRLVGNWRMRAHLTKNDLPIIAYHFNKADERAYCEKGLGIKRDNLLFVGLVEHEKRVPQRVVYRINNVVDCAEATDKLSEEVVDRMGLDPSVLASSPDALPTRGASAVPSTPATAAPDTGVQNSGETTGHLRGLTLLRVVTVDYQGTPQSHFLTTDRGVYVNAYIHNDEPANDQRHTLSVRCLDASGHPYGRPMGGAFSITGGERIDNVDIIRRADPQAHNGYLIKDNALAVHPGHYQVIVEIDGTVVGHTDFDVAVPTR